MMASLSLPSVGKLESLGLLFSLLPGLLTYIVVRALTARERKLDAVEAVLHGLAYTVLVHALWELLTLNSWIPTPDLVGISLCSLVIGLAIAKCHSRGWIYNLLRLCGITEESTWQSAWETSFRMARADGREYAVLYLKDGRRIMGAVRGFSSEQSAGHVAIDRSRWLCENNEVIAIPGLMLLSANDVLSVQFLDPE